MSRESRGRPGSSRSWPSRPIRDTRTSLDPTVAGGGPCSMADCFRNETCVASRCPTRCHSILKLAVQLDMTDAVLSRASLAEFDAFVAVVAVVVRRRRNDFERSSDRADRARSSSREESKADGGVQAAYIRSVYRAREPFGTTRMALRGCSREFATRDDLHEGRSRGVGGWADGRIPLAD